MKRKFSSEVNLEALKLLEKEHSSHRAIVTAESNLGSEQTQKRQILIILDSLVEEVAHLNHEGNEILFILQCLHQISYFGVAVWVRAALSVVHKSSQP